MTMIDRGVAARRIGHKAVMAAIHEKIDNGDLKPGDAVPSGARFGETLKCHRNTVERAYRHLRADGTLAFTRSIGHFVAGKDAEHLPYLQIAALVRKRIKNRTYPPGACVSITVIRDETKRSRATIRRGLQILADEGQLDLLPGTGYHVKAPEKK